MKAVLQRVTEASVVVDDETVGAIGAGLLILLGVEPDDGPEQVAWMVDKTLGLRIFADADKPMNRSLLDIGGEALVVSQFTLAADTRRGRRPSFTTAAAPDHAEAIYRQFVEALEKQVTVATGRFGADMAVSLVNDGPVTFVLERGDE